MKLRIGHLSTFYHTSILMIAQGVAVPDTAWRLFGAGPAIVDAFLKDEIDLAYIGLPPAIIGIDRGLGIKCIAGGHVDGTVIIGRNVSRGYPEISSLDRILQQFVGRKIGVPAKGSIHDVIITDCLERFHLDEKIEIMHFPWADDIIAAMRGGDVAAAVGTPALAVALNRFSGGRILYPPSLLWPDNPSYGILVRENFMEKRRDVVAQFIGRHEEATAFFRSSPVEASRIIAGYVGVVDQDFILDVLNVSPKYCACLTDEYMESTMKFAVVLKKLGYISREISRGQIFDVSLIRDIHPDKDHYRDGIAGASSWE